MIDERVITKAFGEMGARVVFVSARTNRVAIEPRALELDVERDEDGEHFTIRTNPTWGRDLSVLDVRPARRHLVLMLTGHSWSAAKTIRARFLCGHDERHWFVAPLPESARVTTVAQAIEALKPEIVRESERRHGVRGKDRHRRHNDGFVRQGEWFFVPAPEFDATGLVVHRHEPLRRGRGRPHVAEELVRTGGEFVRFNGGYPNGLTEEEYCALLEREPRLKRWTWWTGTRNADVYVRGYVRHADHMTVILRGWHRVVPNTEGEAIGARYVAFID